jgi:hypothetical protein
MITFSNIEFVHPFKNNIAVGIYKKRTLGNCRNKPGCYLIKEDGNIVYVGMSKSCVTAALYRHFYEWNDRNIERVTYFKKMKNHSYEVTIISTSVEEAPKLEQSLIMLLNPRDNKERYEQIIPSLIQKLGYTKSEQNNGWKAVTEDTPF